MDFEPPHKLKRKNGSHNREKGKKGKRWERPNVRKGVPKKVDTRVFKGSGNTGIKHKKRNKLGRGLRRQTKNHQVLACKTGTL